MNGKARHSEKGAELIEMAFVLLLFGNLIAGGTTPARPSSNLRLHLTADS